MYEVTSELYRVNSLALAFSLFSFHLLVSLSLSLSLSLSPLCSVLFCTLYSSVSFSLALRSKWRNKLNNCFSECDRWEGPFSIYHQKVKWLLIVTCYLIHPALLCNCNSIVLTSVLLFPSLFSNQVQGKKKQVTKWQTAFTLSLRKGLYCSCDSTCVKVSLSQGVNRAKMICHWGWQICFSLIQVADEDVLGNFQSHLTSPVTCVSYNCCNIRNGLSSNCKEAFLTKEAFARSNCVTFVTKRVTLCDPLEATEFSCCEMMHTLRKQCSCSTSWATTKVQGCFMNSKIATSLHPWEQSKVNERGGCRVFGRNSLVVGPFWQVFRDQSNKCQRGQRQKVPGH